METGQKYLNQKLKKNEKSKGKQSKRSISN